MFVIMVVHVRFNQTKMARIHIRADVQQTSVVNIVKIVQQHSVSMVERVIVIRTINIDVCVQKDLREYFVRLTDVMITVRTMVDATSKKLKVLHANAKIIFREIVAKSMNVHVLNVQIDCQIAK